MGRGKVKGMVKKKELAGGSLPTWVVFKPQTVVYQSSCPTWADIQTGTWVVVDPGHLLPGHLCARVDVA